MKSRISIDMDWDNQPIIKIEYQESEDVRDKMVKRFMEAFGGSSCYATFFFDNSYHLQTNTRATIRPIGVDEVHKFWPAMKDLADEVQARTTSIAMQETDNQWSMDKAVK